MRTRTIILTALLVLLAAWPASAARWQYSGVVRNSSGQVLPGAQVIVYTDSARTSLATTWDAESGGTSYNGATADDYGRFVFYVDDATYTSAQKFYLRYVSGSTTYNVGPITPIQQSMGSVPTDAIPQTGNTLDLGSAAKPWAEVRGNTFYASGSPGFDDQSTGAATNGVKAWSGGTGIVSYSAGDLLRASGATTLAKLPIGSEGQVLTVSSGLPAWATAPTTGSTPQLSGITVGSNDPRYKSRWPTQYDGKMLVVGTKRIALSSIIAVYVYDTRRDPDGGLWRFATGSSWYNEAAGTYRGARKEFPEVAIIIQVAASPSLYIYDATSGALWMSFVAHANDIAYWATGNGSGISACAGDIWCANIGAGMGRINFPKDYAKTYRGGTTNYLYKGGIGDRNSTLGWLAIGNSGGYLVYDGSTAVDAKVINGTQYAAVSTTLGVSIINTVANTIVDITDGTYAKSYNVKLTGDGRLRAEFTDLTTTKVAYFAALPTSDTTTASATSTSLTNARPWPFAAATRVSNRAHAIVPNASVADGTSDIVAWGTPSGLALIHTKSGAETVGAGELVTTTHHTMPMLGDVRGHWTFDESPTGTVTDRSPAGFDLTAVNTPTKASVASGADTQGYTFNGSDQYLTSRVYHSAAVGTASWYAVGTEWSDGNATFGVTDTGNDLQALYQVSSGNSTHVLVVTDDGGKKAWGDIRTIVKSTNDYTIRIDTTRAGGTQNWTSEAGFNTSAATFTWEIRKAQAQVLTAQTWALSFKQAAAPGASQTIMAKSGSATNWSWKIQINTSGYVYAAISTDGSAVSKAATTTASVCDGAWHRIAVVYTPSTGLYVYVDGELLASNTSAIPAAIYDTWGPVYVARDGGGNYSAATVAMPLITAESYSATQAALMHARTRPWFQASAKTLITGSNIITGASYDPASGLMAVSQDSGSTGSTGIIEVASGRLITSRTTSNSDDSGTAMTSNRSVSCSIINGILALGTTTETWTEDYIGSSDYLVPGRVVSTSAARTITYESLLRVTTGASTLAAYLPAASLVPGREIVIKKVDSGGGSVTVTPAGSDTIDGAASYSLASQYKYVRLRSTGAGWSVVGSN